MSSIVRHASILVTLLGFALVAGAETGPSSPAAAGKPDLESAGQLAFGPGGVLFVADSLGTAVWALDLADGGKPATGELPRIDDVDEKVASLLGTTARDVLLNDLAVHPGSKNIYLSVSRGRGDDARPALVKVDGQGRLSLVELDGLSATKAMITNPPAADAKTRRGQPKRALTITDLAYADGFVYVAGLSNEEFASNLRKIPYPFGGEMSATSVEIFHGAHGKFETHAPIRTMMPYELKGEAHLLASYTCTPLVTLPVAELKDGTHLKGKTIGELGFGNTPLDMIGFTKEGEPYVLILNNRRAGMRFRSQDLEKAGEVSTDVDITAEAPLAGVPYVSVAMGGVLRADNYDDENLVVLRRDVESGALQIRLWATQWI